MAVYKKHLDPEVLSRIGRLELRARMVVEGFISGMHRSPYQGYSVEFATHREYSPGDDIRHLDWRVFGRADRLYIKQYEEETNLRTHILLDGSGSMGYPEHPRPGFKNKYDYASTLAACLIYLLMQQQDACSLTLFDEAIRRQIPPTSKTAHMVGMLELLEEHRPSANTEVKMLLSRLAEQFRQRSMIILISDLLADVEEIVRGLSRLGHSGHDVLVLHVMDEDELTFPFTQNTQFHDLEVADRRIMADPQSLRESYLAIVEDYKRTIRGACMDRRIDYALLSTKTPIDAGLSQFLAKRMHRNAGRKG